MGNPFRDVFRMMNPRPSMQNINMRTTLVLFDLDGTLLDHRAASRAGAAALHDAVRATAPLDQFGAAWEAALDRHYARFLAGEVTFEGQRRARVREVIDDSCSDASADRAFASYLSAYEAAWSLFPDVLPCLER